MLEPVSHISAPSVNNVQLAIEHIYPLVAKYQKEKKVPGASAGNDGGSGRSSPILVHQRPDNKMHYLPTQGI